MADFKAVIPQLEGEEELILAAETILNALRSNKNLTDEARKVVIDLGTQIQLFSTNISCNDHQEENEDIGEIENLLDVVQEKIMSWEASPLVMIWSAGPDEAFDQYLNAADEARKLTKRLETVSLNEQDDDDKKIEFELHTKANDVLRKAMARLEEEFKYLLAMNRTRFEPEHMPSSSEDCSLDFIDNSIEGSDYRDCLSGISEEIVDVVHVDVIPKLRSIATLMCNSNFEQQCAQAYTSARKEAMAECLVVLQTDNNSISLNSKIKRWIRAAQIFVRVVLTSELSLFDQIFGELGQVNLCYFVKASKTSILQLLDFGESIFVGPQAPEKLFRILDSYEALAALFPKVKAFYVGEAGSSIILKFHQLVSRFSDSVRATFSGFEHAIASHNSTINSSLSRGQIHPFSKYVMNYIKTLADYSETLNLLLEDEDEDQGIRNNHHLAESKLSPVGRRFLKVAAGLECKLDEEAKSHKKASLQHLFLMNNINYITRKVKGSELRPVFGEEWIRKHMCKCGQHALDYQKTSWGSLLSLLAEKGLYTSTSTSSSISKILLKDRFKSFNLGFEEIYKTQTGWVVEDVELREDLRISISLKVIPAYRSFVGRYASYLSEKHIKYNADDLEKYLLDLFEGSPKSL